MKRTALFIFLLMALFTASGETMSLPSGASTYITNISNAAERSEFCAAVSGGYDYSGVEVRLTDDITEVSDIVGSSFDYCFKGTFDGQGHTITFSKTVTGNTQYTAPFGFIDGATIKNLKVTGTVTYANGEIIITCDVGDAFNASLQVIDVMGRVIVCRDAINRFSTSGMAPGVYVLRLINGDMMKTQKIIIQ